VEVAIVGALTLDYLGDSSSPVLGGPPVYAGQAAKALGAHVKAYTAVGDDFPQPLIKRLTELGIELSATRVKDMPSYRFKAVFKAGKRMLSMISMGPEIPLQALEDIRADAVIASPVFKEISVEHLSLLRDRTELLVVDLQGFLRNLGENGLVSLKTPAMKEIAPLADVFHCSEEEAAVLTGFTGPAEVAEALQRLGARTTLVGYVEGVLVVTVGNYMFLNVQNNHTPVDTTGAGDMLTGALTALLLKGYSVEEAAANALGYVRLWLRNPPPFRAAAPSQPVPEVKVVWRRAAYRIP